MGLDQYLTRKGRRNNTVVEDEAAYWLKANQIHNWFVSKVQNGVDDCNSYNVTKDHVEELLGTCHSVIKKPELAKLLLPTASGSFFGSTDYDEYYFAQLEKTVSMLEHTLEDLQDGDRLEYYASW